MGKQVGAIGFALYMGRLEQYFGQERQYDADLLLTYGPDADLAALAAFVEGVRARGKTVLCQREGAETGLVRCRTQARFSQGLDMGEVLK